MAQMACADALRQQLTPGAFLEISVGQTLSCDAEPGGFDARLCSTDARKDTRRVCLLSCVRISANIA